MTVGIVEAVIVPAVALMTVGIVEAVIVPAVATTNGVKSGSRGQR